MRALLVFFLCVTLMAGCGTEQRVEFADGSHTELSQWRGQWLVINYWAEWCGPCRHEIPELNQLHAGRLNHGLIVLGVNWDGMQGQKLNDVITRMQIDFPTLIEDPYLHYDYDHVEQLPVTVLINPDREVHRVLMGPQTEQSILAAKDAPKQT
ncbi:MAG: TlpA disulfide reductase family protein [Pseudomonadota bacterium]|jgi:thiol-disulfide isomerase/thioredoxin|nr:TlpA disulfide reductase family protein [Pseudomonadota bacterium]